MQVSGQIHAPATLPQRKSPQYLLGRKLGGPQSLSGRGVEKKNSQPPPGFEPRSCTKMSKRIHICRSSF
jgi:hypothetical protein